MGSVPCFPYSPQPPPTGRTRTSWTTLLSSLRSIRVNALVQGHQFRHAECPRAANVVVAPDPMHRTPPSDVATAWIEERALPARAICQGDEGKAMGQICPFDN
jgi:hypothetical protein